MFTGHSNQTAFFLFTFFILIFLTGPQATVGSHGGPAVRKIDALLDWPWTGNQIKKWSLSANPTAVNEEVTGSTCTMKYSTSHWRTQSHIWAFGQHIHLKNYAISIQENEFVVGLSIMCLCPFGVWVTVYIKTWTSLSRDSVKSVQKS